jgi:hypothetical protein
MKRLLLMAVILALGASCGGVKSGSADGGADGDHRSDGGGTDDDDGADGGGSGSGTCVLGTSQLGHCNL